LVTATNVRTHNILYVSKKNTRVETEEDWIEEATKEASEEDMEENEEEDMVVVEEDYLAILIVEK